MECIPKARDAYFTCARPADTATHAGCPRNRRTIGRTLSPRSIMRVCRRVAKQSGRRSFKGQRGQIHVRGQVFIRRREELRAMEGPRRAAVEKSVASAGGRLRRYSHLRHAT
jgi:alkylated DNA nucleotide flippase Atl1